MRLISLLSLIGAVFAFPIPGESYKCTNVVVSVDPGMSDHAYESHFDLLSMPYMPDLNVVRHFRIGTGFRGYVVSVPTKALDEVLSALSASPDVLVAERDSVGHVDEVETNAPWGLGRISHRYIESDREFQQYVYNKDAGTNVKVYLLDSGIYAEHEEFRKERKGLLPPPPRARFLKSFVSAESDDADLLGHGTHCAGTIGGNSFGVAKNVDIDVIKVCNRYGECLMSEVIAGLEYAVAQFLESPSTAAPKGSLISMSLGLPAEQSLSLAFAAKAAVGSGILIVASAGNNEEDACSHTPASVAEVLTVGATDVADSRASFSNFGRCVDVFAPGQNVLSASNKGPRRTRLMSGTSMSTPHVSGLVAYYLSLAEDGVFTSPEFIKRFIMSRATKNLVEDSRSTNNLLVYNG